MGKRKEIREKGKEEKNRKVTTREGRKETNEFLVGLIFFSFFNTTLQKGEIEVLRV